MENKDSFVSDTSGRKRQMDGSNIFGKLDMITFLMQKKLCLFYSGSIQKRIFGNKKMIVSGAAG
jgi:hypothetical protein